MPKKAAMARKQHKKQGSGAKSKKVEKQMTKILDFLNMREVVVCLFHILNTILAVMSAFLAAGGAVVLQMTLTLSDASELLMEGKPNLKFLVVTGAKLFGISVCGLGFLQFLTAIMGCCGMMHRGPKLLKTFGVVCLVMVLLNLVIMSCASYNVSRVKDDWFKTMLLKTIKRYDGKKNFDTFFIDQAQIKLSCCAILDQKEYQGSKWYRSGNWGVPASCCQLKTRSQIKAFDFSRPEITSEDLLVPGCPDRPAGRAFTTVPCYDKIKDMLLSAYFVVLGATVFSIMLQVGAIYTAFHTARQLTGPKGPKSGKPAQHKSESKIDKASKDV